MITNVLLDLDGTLTDPATGVTNCIAYALTALGVNAPDAKNLHFVIGPSLRDSFATLLETKETVIIERAVVLYRARFADTGLFENIVYNGVPEMLTDLKARNYRLLLATAKPHVYARRILRHFNIATQFDGVYGSELDGTRQHKGDLLRYLLERENLDPTNAVMIGDRHHDIEAARANGCRTIGVAYGYGSAEELAHADRLCDSPAQFAETIVSLDVVAK